MENNILNEDFSYDNKISLLTCENDIWEFAITKDTDISYVETYIKENIVHNGEIIFSILDDYDFNKLVKNKNLKNEKSISELIKKILDESIRLRASDIHIDPVGEKLIIKLRIYGRLIDYSYIDCNVKNELISKIKIMASLDIAEKRRPQEGRIIYKAQNKNIDLRVSFIPLLEGEKATIRILDKERLNLEIDDLGLDKYSKSKLEKIKNYEAGLILITGPSGSGKTTTLYSILNFLKHNNQNILTIEDPVEYSLEGINQSQVDEKIEYTYSSALKAILRQDPDVIVIGEIRDEYIMKEAIKSAETGHLVLATLHTASITSTIFRMINLNIDTYLLSSSLKMIISQRLVRVLCENCKKSYKYIENSDETYFNKETILYESSGCNLCNDGYIGRIPILETLEIDDSFRELLDEKPSFNRISNFIKEKNKVGLKDNLLKLILNGLVSLEDSKKLLYHGGENGI